jgi:hypothetical protein
VAVVPDRFAGPPSVEPDPESGPASPPCLSWLLDCAPSTGAALAVDEERALVVLDKVLATGAVPPDLLPRAAALIPQLLAMLRQTQLPVAALAQRVARDMVLAAEVLRRASSSFYRAQGEVTDLQQAIVLIGEQGLQAVIARVLLKPVFEASPGALGARSAERLWNYAEAMAEQTAQQAAAAGLPAFDGYLAGLLQASGWTVALRVLDRNGILPALPVSARFEAALAGRAHRLFGLAAQGWHITPGFTACAADAAVQPMATSQQPLVDAMRKAQAPALRALAG